MLEAENPDCAAHMERTASRRTPSWKRTDLKEGTTDNTMARRTISYCFLQPPRNAIDYTHLHLVVQCFLLHHTETTRRKVHRSPRRLSSFVSRLLTPCSDADHITPQDAQAYASGRCKLLAVQYVLPSCYWWCPPSNLFTSNKMSSSTRRTGYVRHSQDFPPRAQYMYEKHFHDAKSWPLCCISPAQKNSVINVAERFSEIVDYE